jgi:hypothetical protein
MKKRKYAKPLTTSLSTVSAALGTCASGVPEYDVEHSCKSGATAYAPCSTGDIVVSEFKTCSTGNSAVFSCWHNGHLAG